MLAPAAGVGAANLADAGIRPPRAPSLPLARREDAGQPRDFSGVIFPFAKRVN